MIIMQNEPLHDMACVVKRGAPPGCRWRLCASQHGTKHFFFGDKQYAVEKVRVRQNANNHKYYFPPEVTCIFSVLLLVEPIHKTPNTNEHSCKLESTTLRCISKWVQKKLLCGTCRMVHSWQPPRTVMSDLWPVTEYRCKLLKLIRGADQQEVDLAEQTSTDLEGVADDVLNCLHAKLPELEHGQVLRRVWNHWRLSSVTQVQEKGSTVQGQRQVWLRRRISHDLANVYARKLESTSGAVNH